MNLNQLQAFLKVVETKSFQRAGRILHVSQPTITQRIQTLEEHFNCKLLQRDKSLTPKGEMVYRSAIKILEEWGRLESRLSGELEEGNQMIGASSVPSETFLPYWIQQFRQKYPSVTFQMKIGGSYQVINWLKEGMVDLAITGIYSQEKEVVSYPLLEDTLQLVSPHSFDLQSPTNFRELVHQPWILREKSSHTRQTFETAIQSFGYSIQDLSIVAEVQTNEAVVALVEAGLGMAPLSKLVAANPIINRRVKAIEVEDWNFSRSFYLTVRKGEENSAFIDAFLQAWPECPYSKSNKKEV